MNDHAFFRVAGCRIDIPAFRRRGDEHGPRDRTGLAQRLPCPAYRVRIAGGLHPEQRIDIELLIGWSVLELHLLEVDLELFGDQHRDRSVCALAHFDVRHGQNDLSITVMLTKALGAKVCSAPASAVATGSWRLSSRPPPAAAPAWRKLRLERRSALAFHHDRMRDAQGDRRSFSPPSQPAAACLIAWRMRI